MSDEDSWRWEYDPGAVHVIGGLPDTVVAEVERLAAQLVDLADVGVDVTDLGAGPQSGGPGGVRRLLLPIGGWFQFLPVPRLRLIAVVNVTPPFRHL